MLTRKHSARFGPRAEVLDQNWSGVRRLDVLYCSGDLALAHARHYHLAHTDWRSRVNLHIRPEIAEPRYRALEFLSSSCRTQHGGDWLDRHVGSSNLRMETRLHNRYRHRRRIYPNVRCEVSPNCCDRISADGHQVPQARCIDIRKAQLDSDARLRLVLHDEH
jgi:hypothetical protein